MLWVPAAKRVFNRLGGGFHAKPSPDAGFVRTAVSGER